VPTEGREAEKQREDENCCHRPHREANYPVHPSQVKSLEAASETETGQPDHDRCQDRDHRDTGQPLAATGLGFAGEEMGRHRPRPPPGKTAATVAATTVPMRMAPHHRFIGEAIVTRTEVLGVLHLLDKPDEVWDDPVMYDLYADLRSQFDLADRYEAMESKLRSVQEALQLVLEVARDRRLFLLEVAIVLLILVELLATLR